MLSNMACPHCGKYHRDTARFCPISGKLIFLATTGLLTPNTLLKDRYSILRKLGKGGFGAVYLVTDLRLPGKFWALKEMSNAGLQDPADQQQALFAFQREATLLASLNHPNLTKVIDYFEDQGKHFLVMDYVNGQTLEDMLDARNQPFQEEQILGWAGPLCDVLSYLHSQSPPVVFRDLKPANIMLDHDERIRLIDFGLARLFKPGISKDTVSLGTPGYAAPEQYGKSQSDARSDIYGLGATLHQLLTLREPGIEPFKFPMAKSLNPKISKQVSDAIQKAVAQEPRDRWQTAKDFFQALTSSSAQNVVQTVSGSLMVSRPTISSTSRPQPLQQPIRPARLIFSAPIKGYADHTQRFIAYLIDGVIVGFVSFLISIPFLDTNDETLTLIWLVICLIWVLAYYAGFHARSGQTLGKKLMRIKVALQDGSPPGWWRAIWRTAVLFVLPFLLSSLCLGLPVGLLMYIWPLFQSEHRGLHDILSGTWVVKA